MAWGFLVTLIVQWIELDQKGNELSIYSLFILYLLVTIHFYSTKIFNRLDLLGEKENGFE
jgi:hypothetical protein